MSCLRRETITLNIEIIFRYKNIRKAEIEIEENHFRVLKVQLQIVRPKT